MKKHFLSLCLSAIICAVLPTAGMAQTTQSALNASAPTLSAETLRSLTWQPLDTNTSQNIELTNASQKLNQGEIQGNVAAFSIPANLGSLEITISSIVQNKQVYVPNVVVFDQQMRPAAFYPASYFPYEPPGIVSSDRLEGKLKLTPALGQQQIYILVYTTRSDLAGTTTLLDPAKAYAQGVGNAVPAINDPIAQHSDTGMLKIKVQSERNSGNIVIGQTAPAPTVSEPVVIGATAQPAGAPAESKPLLNDTEAYFNDAIKKAVKSGNIDKAINLLNEAERLGSHTARETFISSVDAKRK